MQLSNLFIAIMATATAVSATCHKSGETWNNKADARSAITKACTGSGKFAGSFGIQEIRRFCVNSGGKQKMNFEVQNKGSTARNWDDAECIHRLSREVDGCKDNKGGYNTVDNWYYQADPNAGQC
ncbi:hypothetical protein QBC36DRAFT_182768 [Triangularia setosa]|uniref:Secreted protein n=1 Tax=Triangularia setosa TaxID=2587417 RepID=A0AAN6WC50_9PEZI|nr:hypothetical protein QBC36DRAFT_182768 [Podospora setosa]